MDVDFYAIHEWDSSISGQSHKRSVDVIHVHVISGLKKYTKAAFCGEKILRLLKDSEKKFTLENQCLKISTVESVASEKAKS